MFINEIYQRTVVFLSTVSLSVIFFFSLISTCYRASDSREITYFCRDSKIKNIIFILVFLVLYYVVHKLSPLQKFKSKLNDDAFYNQAKKYMLRVIFLICIVWVLVTQFLPGSDQLDVIDCAYKLHAGEYNMLDPGGYLDRWTNQIGLVLINYFLSKFWGYFNITAFQVLNVVGLTLLYKMIVEVLEENKVSRLTQIELLVSGIVFFPFLMYTSFVYGTIWHMTLSMVAFYNVVKYLKDSKWWRILISAVTMALAVQVKNNAWIFCVAILIYLLLSIVNNDDNRLKKSFYIIFILSVSIMVAKLPAYYIEKLTGYVLNQGVSSWAFIAMGLQESEEEYPPGWWNGYNNQTYERVGCYTDKQAVLAKKEIENKLKKFANDKAYAVRFFSKKLASMWAEPTYQCYWINQIRNHRVTYSDKMTNAFSAENYTKAADILDYIQTLIYLGSLLWLIFESKEDFNTRSFFMLTFLGGFIFHVFWEAKTQYSIVYTIMLLPCAVMGFERLIDHLDGIKVNGSEVLDRMVIIRELVCCVCLISVCIAYKKCGEGCLTSDDNLYNEYLATWVQPYTNESMLDIAHIKADKEYDEGMLVFLNHLLEINGITY
ncbi:hypothetical protein [Pseudobutyrivibrio xylanivorans]|uniref:hypothetical protein n=1 Tax=Pseudobutyrivibrio xylanivorans TaxID=185007 RepID=UPI00124DC49E|nr:hypothetical protein [Pseudobutyrivibrio xylanivorans]